MISPPPLSPHQWGPADSNTPGRIEADVLAISKAIVLQRVPVLKCKTREYAYFVRFFDKGAKSWPWVSNFRTMKADGDPFRMYLMTGDGYQNRTSGFAHRDCGFIVYRFALPQSALFFGVLCYNIIKKF